MKLNLSLEKTVTGIQEKMSLMDFMHIQTTSNLLTERPQMFSSKMNHKFM